MQTAELHSERVTFLATPALKERLSVLAKASGLSIGEYVRRRIQEDDGEALSRQEEDELVALVDQVNEAVPHMSASLDDMSRAIREARANLDASLRAAGVRK